MTEPPSQVDVEQVLHGLLSGRLSREQADRWAAQWVTQDSPQAMPEAVWTALTHLFGCDARHGPGQEYLHTNEQISEWLASLREAT